MASRAGTGARARAREKITDICRGETDARALRLAVLTEIRRVVGFDAYAWLLTDPETSVGSSPLADVPCLPELPQLIRLKYLTAVNRWTSLAGGAASLVRATGGDLSRSLMWREMLGRYRVADIASSVYRDRFGCWGFVDLWRIGAAGSPFAPADLGFLDEIAGPVSAALRRSQAQTFAATRANPPAASGPAVLLLSPALEVRAQTPPTQRYLRLLVPPEADQAPVPAGAYNVAAQLLAAEAKVDGSPPLARVHLAGAAWLTLRAARMDARQADTEVDIAVSVETASARDRVTLFARASGLSSRETEVVQHLVSGADTRDMARLMFVSEHTVQDHLKSIFGKTGTHSRRTLLAHALGS